MRPDWSFVMVGPVVKIADEDLPRGQHPLSRRQDLRAAAAYLAGWDVALMPFAMNESTQFISPTKTPEYLAGGKPVVSTPIKDVVRHYGHLEGVRSPATRSFVAACDERRSSCSRNRPAAAGSRSRPDAVVDQLGHDPGAHGRADRRSARHAHRQSRGMLVAAE
jgi:hypothetical protein